MKVIFFGNSHTYVNEVPHIVTLIGARVGIEIDATMLVHGGMSLNWHAGQPQTWFNIKYGHYDKAVLQNVAHPFDGVGDLREGATAICEMLRQADTKPYLYMTWASRRNPEVQAEMISAYQTVGEELSATVAPVGVVWQRVREDTDIDLFHCDGEHASIYGSYLAACVIFYTLTDYRERIPTDGGVFAASVGADIEKLSVIERYVFDTLFHG